MIIAPLTELRDEVAWVVGAQSKENEPLVLACAETELTLSCGPVWDHRSAIVSARHKLWETIAVPARVLSDWLQTQRGYEVTLQISDGRLVVKAKGVCRLPLLAQPSHSSRTEHAGQYWFTADGAELRAGLGAVLGHGRTLAVSAHAWEYSVHLSAGQVFGGSPYSMALAGPTGGAEKPAVQVDRRQLKEALSHAEGPVEVLRSDAVNLVWLRYAGRTAQLGIQDYKMPDLTRLFDAERELELSVSAEEMLIAVKSVSVETDVVEVIGDGSEIVLTARQSSKGLDPNGLATATVEYTGPPFSRRLDAGFVSAALSTIQDTARIHWSEQAPRRPIVIDSEESAAGHCIATVRTETSHG